MPTEAAPWKPSRILRVVAAYPTGSAVVRVETDQGEGFLKALSNKTEPHNLGSELVGTILARWFKLPTLEFHLITLTPAERIQLADGSFAHPGQAFITRLAAGSAWDGRSEKLDLLDNPGDIGRLIVFDTWTRNCDRYMPRDGPRINRDNVFLSEQNATPGRFLLKAIDHGCCFTCGRDLTVKLRDLDCVQENKLYGRFPQFSDRTERMSMLRLVEEAEAVPRQEVEAMIHSVPREWDLNTAVRQALCDFICLREVYQGNFQPRVARSVFIRRPPGPGTRVMTPRTGYYSIIQYCPDPSRLEAANVGVVLFSPEPFYLKARTAKGNDRIRQCFQPVDPDWARIKVIKYSIENRLTIDRDEFRDLASLERFAATRARRYAPFRFPVGRRRRPRCGTGSPLCPAHRRTCAPGNNSDSQGP